MKTLPLTLVLLVAAVPARAAVLADTPDAPRAATLLSPAPEVPAVSGAPSRWSDRLGIGALAVGTAGFIVGYLVPVVVASFLLILGALFENGPIATSAAALYVPIAGPFIRTPLNAGNEGAFQAMGAVQAAGFALAGVGAFLRWGPLHFRPIAATNEAGVAVESRF